MARSLETRRQQVEDNPRSTEQKERDDEQREANVELLGKSFRVRRTIDQGVTKTITGMHDRMASVKNKLSTPKNVYLENRYLSAKEKYERRQKKADNARWRLTQNYHQNRANKLEEKMNGKKDKFDAHTDLMQGRVDHAKNRRDFHEGIHNDKVEMYKDRKANAQARKEIRHAKRELKNDGKSRIEVARIMSNISPEQRKSIGVAALRLERAQADRSRVSREKSRVQYEQSSNEERIKTNAEDIQRATLNQQQLSERITSDYAKQGELTSRIDTLKEQLEDPETSEAQRADLEIELGQAQLESTTLENSIAESQKRLDRATRDIKSLQDDIANRQAKAPEFDAEIAGLETKIADHNETVSQLEEARNRVVNDAAGHEVYKNVTPDQDTTVQQQTPPPQPGTTPSSQSTSGDSSQRNGSPENNPDKNAEINSLRTERDKLAEEVDEVTKNWYAAIDRITQARQQLKDATAGKLQLTEEATLDAQDRVRQARSEVLAFSDAEEELTKKILTIDKKISDLNNEPQAA